MDRKRITNRTIILPVFILLFGVHQFSVSVGFAQSANRDAYDWLQFNFDPQHSGNNTKETKITPQNVGSLHQLFKVTLPSTADGAPAYLSNVKTTAGIVDILFVTTKDAHIVALDAANGNVIWSHQYGSGDYRINNHGYCRCLGRAKPRGLWRLAFPGAHCVFACLASLRPSERGSGVERVQSWRVRPTSHLVRGWNGADTWRVGSGSALAPGRDRAQASAL